MRNAKARKFFKIVLRIFIAGFALFLITATIGYIWLRGLWKERLTEERSERFAQRLLSAPDLPERFYEIYELVYDIDTQNTTHDHMIRQAFLMLSGHVAKYPCPCFEVNYGPVLNTLDRFSYGIELDNRVGPKKCLDGYVNTSYFGSGIKGVDNVAQYYFGKPFAGLSDKEFVIVCLMLEAPSFYNVIENPKMVNKMADEILAGKRKLKTYH